MDKLTAMTTFAAVAEAGSFTRASDVLSLPNARVSQRIADLEQHLGVRLLHRTTRSLHLTEDGEAYLIKCKQILQEINELEGALKHGSMTARGTLRVEALVSVARWLIAPHLHEFQRLHPNITVRLGSSDHVRHLLDDGIDCAIRGGFLESSSQIARHLADVHLGLYAAPQYLAKNSPIHHPQDLAEHQRVSWFSSPKNPFAWHLVTEEEHVELRQQDGLMFDDPDVAIASCMAGAGVCPSAPFAVQAWVQQGLLVPVLPHWRFEVRPIHIIYSSNQYLPARVRSFIDWVVVLMKSNPYVGMTPLALAETLADSLDSSVQPSSAVQKPKQRAAASRKGK